MEGILVVDKKAGMTSRDVVNLLMRQFSMKKVGHTGTLDPMATGVLIVCFGKSTKLAEVITAYEKEYVFEAELGTETDTYDCTGTVLQSEIAILSKEEIEQALRNMVGKMVQEVPFYSAVKVNGKKLYEYARRKEEVKLPKREVAIHCAELQRISYTEKKTHIQVKVVVSKGTYIRSFIHDLAHRLHTVGMMTSLRRTKQGEFKIEDAFSLEEIEANKYTCVPLLEVLKMYKQIEVPLEEKKKIQNGMLLLKDTEEDIVLYTYNDLPLALYKTYEKDTRYRKPWKML